MALDNGTLLSLVGEKPSAPCFMANIEFDGDDAYPGGYHHARLDDDDSIPAVPTTLAEAIVFLNTLKAKVNAHLASVTVHEVASAAAIAAADASDLATGDTLAAEIVADFNTHRTEATVHSANDATNVMVDSTGGTLALLLATCTSIRTFWLVHCANTLGTTLFQTFVRTVLGRGAVELLGVVDTGCGLYVPRYYPKGDTLAMFVRTTGLNVAAATDLSGVKHNVVVLCK